MASSAKKRKFFRVYVDEAGDRGWGGRASPVFVVSAVVVPDDRDVHLRAVLTKINRTLGRDPRSVLHWSENVKVHSQRKLIARTLGAATDAVFINVVLHKTSLMKTGSGLHDSTRQYNYAIRLLLERVSWYVNDHGGRALITFSHVKGFPYRALHDYLELLTGLPTEIRWPAIHSWKNGDPKHRRLLQMADLVAGCVYAAVRPDDYGDHEPGYLMELAPRIYARGKVGSYGFKWIGASGCEKSYPWWPDFVDACHAA